MICDTTFVSDLLRERLDGRARGAQAFLAAHRNRPFLITVISVGETAAMYANPHEVRPFLSRYRQLRLTPEIAYAAASVDQELIRIGQRLGENDNWIAGFCRYYGQPIISRDGAFDRVRGLRRFHY
jgi:predicted nucleic acid-binding protein